LNIIYLIEINKEKKGEAAAAREGPWLARYRSQAAGVAHARPLEAVARPGWAPAYWVLAGRLHARLWAGCVPAPGQLHALALTERELIDRIDRNSAAAPDAFPCVT
jgi:hypothetical protein